MNRITINGETFIVDGKNINVSGSKVIVDGKVVKGDLEGIVKIEWSGDLANLDCTNAVINGNVEGDVDCTNLTCGNIGGDVDATNVKCGDIGGDVDAMKVTGNIKM